MRNAKPDSPISHQSRLGPGPTKTAADSSRARGPGNEKPDCETSGIGSIPRRSFFYRLACRSLTVARLSEQFPDHLAMHVRQSKVPTGMTIGQAFMIQANCVQNGGVQVV